jgi:hypothetical protein
MRHEPGGVAVLAARRSCARGRLDRVRSPETRAGLDRACGRRVAVRIGVGGFSAPSHIQTCGRRRSDRLGPAGAGWCGGNSLGCFSAVSLQQQHEGFHGGFRQSAAGWVRCKWATSTRAGRRQSCCAPAGADRSAGICLPPAATNGSKAKNDLAPALASIGGVQNAARNVNQVSSDLERSRPVRTIRRFS